MSADDAMREARTRALASPLRMRILRLCLHEAKTNKQLAEELQLNPGTLLHHVRALETTGLLRKEEPRRGTRGAREVPYRATKLSWGSGMDDGAPILLETFLQEIEGLAPREILVTRLGLKLSPENRSIMLDRFAALFQEYADREPDPHGDTISLLFVEHPDVPRADRASAARARKK